MRDRVGQELAIGDRVAFIQHSRTSSSLSVGVVSRFTEKFVFIDTSQCHTPLRSLYQVKPFKVVKYVTDE